jgi:hypothetical protein
VAAVSANDIWAVGYYADGATSRTLIEHWDGSTWSLATSPNVGTGSNYLEGVEAVSANDVWAVGFYLNGATRQTLILRWNGSAWSVVSSPNSGSNDNFLYNVEVVTASDAWAVGYYYYGSINQTLILRWNGSTWSVVPSPNIGTNTNGLQGITAVASDDIWAVGWYNNGTVYRTLTLHWNGAIWATVASPNQGATGNYLYDVKAIAANDVWAVGAYGNTGTYQTLILHWNGNTWSVVPSPNVGTGSNVLLGIAAVSANDIWAVGYYATGTTTERTLVQHWNGSAWDVVSSPNMEVDENRLSAVAVVAQDYVWATGYAKETVFQTLIERYSCAACTIQFTDVLPGSTFYDFVRCMACQGIINGYTSGCETGNPCFRPGNNITRGQLSKIVSNAAGFTEPAGAQQYEDVPPGSTFFDFVWRLSNRGYVGGYACGGLGEPCGGGNLPYFRPNANATRGQISKIVSNAAGFTEPAGNQLFQDVAPGSTFYDFIQRLANRGVISGYQCGGPGEPCVQPGNLPYFRPGNNATRGQTSKIVSNTFFPGCSTP